MSIAELEHVSQQIDERQMEIPGLDGYKADRLLVTISGGVEYASVQSPNAIPVQSEDIAFVKSLKLGQEVTLTVTATVTKKGFALTPGRDDLSDDRTAFGVGLKVHSLEQA